MALGHQPELMFKNTPFPVHIAICLFLTQTLPISWETYISILALPRILPLATSAVFRPVAWQGSSTTTSRKWARASFALVSTIRCKPRPDALIRPFGP